MFMTIWDVPKHWIWLVGNTAKKAKIFKLVCTTSAGKPTGFLRQSGTLRFLLGELIHKGFPNLNNFPFILILRRFLRCLILPKKGSRGRTVPTLASQAFQASRNPWKLILQTKEGQGFRANLILWEAITGQSVQRVLPSWWRNLGDHPIVLPSTSLPVQDQSFLGTSRPFIAYKREQSPSSQTCWPNQEHLNGKSPPIDKCPNTCCTPQLMQCMQLQLCSQCGWK